MLAGRRRDGRVAARPASSKARAASRLSVSMVALGCAAASRRRFSISRWMSRSRCHAASSFMKGCTLDPPLTSVLCLPVIITDVQGWTVTDIIDLEMADRETATGVVGLVQAYVNTVDVQDGPEELSDPNTVGAWLVAHGLMASGQTVTEADLKHAIAVREAIRGVIGANSGGRAYPLDLATLNEAATASRLRARFGADGKARLEPEASGGAGAMGRLVAALFGGMAAQGWSPRKLVGPPTGQGAFYDRART